MKYCCKYMKELDEKEIIDYCPPHLTTLDVKKVGYIIYFCPFCGKEIEGCKKFARKLKRQVKGIKDGTIKTISLEELKCANPKGCGKEFTWLASLNDKRICGQMEDLKHSDHIILCPKCTDSGGKDGN